MEQNLSLSPAQIQYLKIGPKVGTSTTTTRQLQESLTKFDAEESDAATSLSGMPKFSYGNFEKTVNNFGVLLHRNFVGTTTLHQAQKFGKVAQMIDEVMQEEKDKPVDQRNSGQKRSFIDSRTRLKAIYEHRNFRLLLTLTSFVIEDARTQKVAETLPLAYIKLMINHVSSGRLVKAIENSMRSQGSSMVIIDYEKMQSKVSNYQNNDDKYSQGPFILQRNGHEFNIIPPMLEIYHSQSEYKNTYRVDNRDILDILQSDFDNVDAIFDKYADIMEFEDHVQKIDSESKYQAKNEEIENENKEDKKDQRPESHHSEKRQAPEQEKVPQPEQGQTPGEQPQKKEDEKEEKQEERFADQ